MQAPARSRTTLKPLLLTSVPLSSVDARQREHSMRKPGSHAARSPQDRWPHRSRSSLSETSIRFPQTKAAADTMQAALTSSAVRPAGLAQAVRPSAQRPRVARAVVCRCVLWLNIGWQIGPGRAAPDHG